MRIDVMFWFSIVICGASFLVFAWQVIKKMKNNDPTPPVVTGSAGGAAQQTIDVVKAVAQLAELAKAFEKAGPIATSAVLCAFFGLLALLSSGVVKIQG